MRAIFFVVGLVLLGVGAHVTITRTIGYRDAGALLILVSGVGASHFF